MKKKYSYLSKNIFLFAISSFAPKILVFVMVPLYTSYLSTEEYGVSDLISTSVSLALPVLTLCVDSSALRFCINRSVSELKNIYSSILYIFIRGVIICALGTIVAYFSFFTSYEYYYFLFFVIIFVALGGYNVFSCIMRGVDRVELMVVMSIISTTVTCISNYFFLVVLSYGIKGYLIANSLGYIVAVLLCLLMIKGDFQFRLNDVSSKLVKEMEKYGFPLVFSQIGWWINNSVDKYVICFFESVAMNGIYSVAYKIPSILSAVSGIFANAWTISAVKEFDPDDSDGFVIKMYDLYNTVLLLGCSLINIFNLPLAEILYAKDFFVAWKYSGLLMMSMIFNALAIFIGAIFSAVKDTKIYAKTTIIGGIINIFVSTILIQYISILGVAIGTLIANIVIWWMRFVESKKYIKLRVNLKRDCALYILLLLQVCVTSYCNNLYTYMFQVIVFIVLCLSSMKYVKIIISMVCKKIHMREEKENDN